MIHPDTYTSLTSKGVALFAKRRFKKGEIVWIADKRDIKMSLNIYQRLSKREQQRIAQFGYIDSHQNIISPNDNGKYVNHACSPNCTYLAEFDNVSIVLRDIEMGEEITENYRSYYKHLAEFDCKCGMPNCTGALKKDDNFHQLSRCRLDDLAPLVLQHQQVLLAVDFEGKKQFLTLLKQRAYGHRTA